MGFVQIMPILGNVIHSAFAYVYSFLIVIEVRFRHFILLFH
jgi:hypothetical protein